MGVARSRADVTRLARRSSRPPNRRKDRRRADSSPRTTTRCARRAQTKAHAPRPMDVRRAMPSDLDLAVETITLAFLADPVWGPALSRPDDGDGHLRAYWRFFLSDAIDEDGVRVADDGAAVSVWVPPGGEELRPENLDALERFNADTLGPDGAAEMAELYER